MCFSKDKSEDKIVIFLEPILLDVANWFFCQRKRIKRRYIPQMRKIGKNKFKINFIILNNKIWVKINFILPRRIFFHLPCITKYF